MAGKFTKFFGKGNDVNDVYINRLRKGILLLVGGFNPSEKY